MLRQLLPFAADKTHRSIDQLKIDDLSAERARSFLCGVEIDRGRRIATRSQRVAGIRSEERSVAAMEGWILGRVWEINQTKVFDAWILCD